MTSTFDISIIIVGFNAEAFLKLTLFSVYKSIKNISAEVLFIDNSNNQDLVSMVKTNFPWVSVINNTKNIGFGKANNIALKQCKGRIALLLNPDTIVSDIVLNNVISYYKQNPNIGGIGVKMIDGTGAFLRESKRGFPDIFTSFCKFSGLSRFFPHSKIFAKYYASNINADSVSDVDILAGAFIAMPRSKNGSFHLFDNSFFMYGEDVDLSHRLQQSNDSNVYLGSETIIHFKGKSTETSTHIIYHFFHSMWIFYKLHLSKKHSSLTNLIVYSGIKSMSYFQMLRSKHLNVFGKKTIDISSVKDVLVISDKTDVLSLIKQLKIFNTVDSSVSLKTEGVDLVIFDLNFISPDKVISLMNVNAGSLLFGFLTGDYSHLIMSHSSFDKGQVLSLSN